MASLKLGEKNLSLSFFLGLASYDTLYHTPAGRRITVSTIP